MVSVDYVSGALPRKALGREGMGAGEGKARNLPRCRPPVPHRLGSGSPPRSPASAIGWGLWGPPPSPPSVLWPGVDTCSSLGEARGPPRGRDELGQKRGPQKPGDPTQPGPAQRRMSGRGPRGGKRGGVRDVNKPKRGSFMGIIRSRGGDARYF